MPGVKKAKKTEKKRPLVIVGGGPAGMTAAVFAAKHFEDVVLFDKNPEPGKKLRSISKGNFIISEELSSDKLAKAFGEKENFVKPALKAFGNKELSAYLSEIGIKVSSNGSGHLTLPPEIAQEIAPKLNKAAEDAGVTIKKSSKVSDLVISKNQVTGIVVNSVEFPASGVIVACGSVASPARGATDDGYKFAQKAGHEITPIKSALVGLETVEKYGKYLADAEFKDCKIEIVWNDKSELKDRGSLRFSEHGIEGDLVYTYSSRIIEMLAQGRSPGNKIEIHIDMIPDVDKKLLESWVASRLEQAPKMSIGTLFEDYIPEKLRSVMAKITRVHSDKPVANLSTLERKALLLWVKDFHVTISRPRPFNETYGVIGGVSIDEIEKETMRSKKVSNLYFAGEVLDLLGPWGGYNMQMAFSTGHLAGISAAKGLKEK